MIDYYNDNSDVFIKSTVDCKMDEVYEPFLKNLNEGDRILDAGCGSGRDSLQFKKLGFNVEAFDISEKMVEAATDLTGIAVRRQSFLDIEYKEEFDAVWACASLLHVNRKMLPEAFKKLHEALKKDGIMYCSFKLREQDYIKDGRSFTCFNEIDLNRFIKKLGIFEILQIYVTHDSRVDRKNELWINTILKKSSTNQIDN
ncbi:MAG: class I SAM-dependent methyltransferase [Sphaerochaetaceae bacterium]|nr:class I SAM-dependent methyltransferase [Sphaerochaetaceae bacterium]